MAETFKFAAVPPSAVMGWSSRGLIRRVSILTATILSLRNTRVAALAPRIARHCGGCDWFWLRGKRCLFVQIAPQC